MNWGNHLHGQGNSGQKSRPLVQAGASTSPPGVIVSATFPAYGSTIEISLQTPGYFRRDSVAICRDRSRQRQELLSQPPLPSLTLPDACLLPWAMLPRSRDSRFAARSSPSSRPAASSGASQRPGRSQHPRCPPPPRLCRPLQEGGKPFFFFFSGRGCSEGGIQRIPALPMEPLCASAAPDLSRRRRLAGS